MRYIGQYLRLKEFFPAADAKKQSAQCYYALKTSLRPGEIVAFFA
jgi:hypothetical protein